MLVNRQSQIPNGNYFYDPVTKFQAPPYTSFRVICEGWAIAIKGNLALAWQNKLPVTMPEIERRVDEFLTAVCARNGWTKFIREAGPAQVPFRRPTPLPPPKPTLRQSIRNVAAGSRILVEWIVSGAEAVAPELANQRAAVCASCPLNETGDWLRWFTVPVAAEIKKALDTKATWKLSTPSDDRLMVCGACSCPLKLKVHMPLDKFYDKMTDEAKNALAEGCWIRSEVKRMIVNAVDEGLKKQ